MQIIVSNTNLGVMFKASELVLSKYGKNAGTEVPENIKGQSVLSVLKSLLGGTYFDICKWNKLVELHNTEVSDEHSKWLHSLHCIHYTDMHADTREYLTAIAIQYFKPVISMTYAQTS